MKFAGLMMVLFAVAAPMLASTRAPVVPEINAATGAAAIALVSGGNDVLRSRRRK